MEHQSTLVTLEHVHLLYDELGRLVQRDELVFLVPGVTPVHPVTITDGPLRPGAARSTGGSNNPAAWIGQE